MASQRTAFCSRELAGAVFSQPARAFVEVFFKHVAASVAKCCVDLRGDAVAQAAFPGGTVRVGHAANRQVVLRSACHVSHELAAGRRCAVRHRPEQKCQRLQRSLRVDIALRRKHCRKAHRHRVLGHTATLFESHRRTIILAALRALPYSGIVERHTRRRVRPVRKRTRQLRLRCLRWLRLRLRRHGCEQCNGHCGMHSCGHRAFLHNVRH